MVNSCSLTQAAPSDWRMAGYDAGNTSWNRVEQSLRPPLKIAWRYRPSHNVLLEDVIVAQGMAFVSSDDRDDGHRVFAVDATNGREKWAYRLTGGGGGSMGIAPALGQSERGPLLYFGGQGDDNLYAVEAMTGRKKWTLDDLGGMYDTDPKIAKRVVFAQGNRPSGRGRVVMAVDAADGRERWELPRMGRQSDMAIDGDTLLLGGAYTPPLLAIHAWKGSVLWQSKGYVGPRLSAMRGTVYAHYSGEQPVEAYSIGYLLNRVAAFRVSDGRKLWETRFDDDFHYGSLAFANDIVYTASWKTDRADGRGVLYALDARDGRLIGQRDDGATASTIVVANDVVYVCSWDHDRLHALHPKKLNTLWSMRISRCEDMVVADGRLYVVSSRELVAYESAGPDALEPPIASVPRQPDIPPTDKGGIFGTPQTPDRPQSAASYGSKQAIVIGISDYQDLDPPDQTTALGRITDLQFARKDAESFTEFLRNDPRSGGGWRVHTLVGKHATTVRVKETLAEVLAGASKNDLVYIFFSGHARRSPTDPGEVYLLTQDFRYEQGYSGIWYEWFKRKILASDARNIIAFIDACRSGTVGFAKGPATPDQEMLGEIQGLTGFKAVFTAGQGEEVAYEDSELGNGVFTHFLLRGLRGEADNLDGDRFVDLAELEEYVRDKVKIYTQRKDTMNLQRPRLFGHAGLLPSEFPVALRK